MPRTAILLAAFFLAACTDGPENLFVPGPAEEVAESAVPVVLAAGDIGSCDPASETAATAKLLDSMAGTILALGDIAYPDGGPVAYRRCFDPTWGRHRERIRPVPGNHDYEFPGADQYFAYFGAAAGERGLGYYSFEIGDWLLIGLNSQIDLGGGSQQAEWLRRTLAATPTRCAVAYLHHARFSSGSHGNHDWLVPMWEILDAAGVDLVLSGHDHHYERFAPQDAEGRRDAGGVRQFVVGTGGAYVLLAGRRAANSEVLDGATFGVLRLELRPGRYTWRFVSTAGSRFTDAGEASCR